MDTHKRDIVSGGILAVFSLINLIISREIKESSRTVLNPACFPRVCLGAMLVIGLILMVKGGWALWHETSVQKQAGALRRAQRLVKANAPDEEVHCGAVTRHSWRVLLVLIVLALANWLLPLLGFIVVGVLYLFTTMLVLNPKRVDRKTAAVMGLISLIAPILVYYLFTNAFQLMLPAGSLWG